MRLIIKLLKHWKLPDWIITRLESYAAFFDQYPSVGKGLRVFAAAFMTLATGIFESWWPMAILVGGGTYVVLSHWPKSETSNPQPAMVDRPDTDDRLFIADMSLNYLISAQLTQRDVQILEEALAKLPAAGPIDPTDDALGAETRLLNEYIDDLTENIQSTQWADDLNRQLRLWEANADADMPRASVPPGVNPYIFRLHYIARIKRDYLQEFLEMAVRRAKQNRRDISAILLQRKEHHHARRT